MATFKAFTDITAWQKARILSEEIFKITLTGTFSRDFALKDQINRSSGSVMDNIAEGFERSSRLEFVNFITYSKGSVGEVISQLYRAKDRGHITDAQANDLIAQAEDIGRMLNGLIGYLNQTNIRGFKFKDRI